MQTATDLGNLEKVLADTAQAKGVSARMDLPNESTILVDIDSGFSGGMSFTFEKNGLKCSAKSYKMGGNYSIKDALAKAGIYSEVVDSGPECDSKEVQFTVPYLLFRQAIDVVYTAFKKLELSGV